MSPVCSHCGQQYEHSHRIGNTTDGPTRTICSNTCYYGWLAGRQAEREKQDRAGLVELTGLFAGKLLGQQK